MTQERRGQRFPNLPLSARSLEVTLALPLPLVYQRFHLLASRLAALPCALCVLVLQSTSVDPSARSEGFCVGIGAAGPDDEDAGSCCAAGAGSWDSVAGSAIGPTPAPTGAALASLVSQCPCQSHSTCFCVRSQTDTATAARRCTMPSHDLRSSSTHVNVQVGLGSVASQSSLSSLPPCRSNEVFALSLNSLITNLFFRRHAVERSCFLDSSLRENDVFVCHWRHANPDSMAPSLTQIACWHVRVLVHHVFL